MTSNQTGKFISNFTIGPRQVTALYDRTKCRIVVRAIIHNGQRVDRAASPELWVELRGDFLSTITK